MSDQKTFGAQLREARLQAGFSSQAKFADYLSTRGLPYSDEAVGHWECDRRKPESSNLLPILASLAAAGGITHLATVNHLLNLVGRRNLTPEEIEQYFSALPRFARLPNLPPQPYDQLIGRDEQLDVVQQQLVATAAKPVCVLSGLGGIGKTALAYEVAARLLAAQHFQDVVWFTARPEGFTDPAAPPPRAEAINLHQLLVGIAAQLHLPTTPDLDLNAIKIRLREVLRGGSYLVVLDNLESLTAVQQAARTLHELVSPPGKVPPSKILITSRERLLAESFVYDLALKWLVIPAFLGMLGCLVWST